MVSREVGENGHDLPSMLHRKVRGPEIISCTVEPKGLVGQIGHSILEKERKKGRTDERKGGEVVMDVPPEDLPLLSEDSQCPCNHGQVQVVEGYESALK